MPPKLRITRNPEANDLTAHITSDAAMMEALTTAAQEFWEHYKAEFAAADRSSWDPSPLLVPPMTDLIIALIERKVAALRSIPQERGAASALETLSKKASLYPVADDILRASLSEYRPMVETGQFEVIDQSTQQAKPWWQFW